ncbi:MAG: hypothetical protein OXD45_03105 [Rhodobacteraceae bacterium]|nr:hypothetical protein [Paracoccaceae bacterium]
MQPPEKRCVDMWVTTWCRPLTDGFWEQAVHAQGPILPGPQAADNHRHQERNKMPDMREGRCVCRHCTGGRFCSSGQENMTLIRKTEVKNRFFLNWMIEPGAECGRKC